ncbi:MAG: LacI family DNA-binding transcriptional regulator [Clostridia bacterium]|nr:LacI family DNA-binding transcriptional regulator [Clostridia bacterium]
MVTLKDVAKEAGLTVTTVSRVLNNRGYISEEARIKVQEAMKKLNYQPNEVARSLSKQKTDTIGLIVPSISHPYFASLIHALERVAEDKHYKILLFNSNADLNLEEQYMDKCRGSKVAGIILFSGRDDNKYLSRVDVPVVALERYQKEAVLSIEVDNYEGGKLAAEILMDKGCRNLLEISAVYESYMPSDDRENGFRAACEKRNIPFKILRTDASLLLDNHEDQMIEEILKSNPTLDGIFTGSDLIAASVLKICKKLNINVPEQLKIVGYDNIYLTRYLYPGITTIAQPINEIASLAVETLIKANKDKEPSKRILLPVSLIERESTGL